MPIWIPQNVYTDFVGTVSLLCVVVQHSVGSQNLPGIHLSHLSCMYIPVHIHQLYVLHPLYIHHNCLRCEQQIGLMYVGKKSPNDMEIHVRACVQHTS